MTTTNQPPVDLDAIRHDLDALSPTWNGVRIAAHAKQLLAEVERLRAAYAELGRIFDTTVEVSRSNRRHAATLAAVVDAAYAFADEMADYCSPHAVSSMYAKRLREALDRAKPTDPAA